MKCVVSSCLGNAGTLGFCYHHYGMLPSSLTLHAREFQRTALLPATAWYDVVIARGRLHIAGMEHDPSGVARACAAARLALAKTDGMKHHVGIVVLLEAVSDRAIAGLIDSTLSRMKK